MRHLEILFIFLLSCLLSLGHIQNLCTISYPLTFDNQALLVWEYTASLGMIPYRDIFYPYGIVSYLKGHDVFFSIVYFFLLPLLLTGIFFTLRRLFTNTLLAYSFFFSFYLFVSIFTGFDVFNRYGIVVVLSFLFAYIFFYRNKFFYRYIFLTGILVGIIFSLVNDQGVYGVILFFVFLAADILLRKNLSSRAIRQLAESRGIFSTGQQDLYPASQLWKIPRLRYRFARNDIWSVLYGVIIRGSIFLAGFFIGSIPFIMYLHTHQALTPFITHLQRIPELSQYAKTPFFHAIVTRENIFTFVALFITLMLLIYQLVIIRKRASFATYIQIGLVCIIVLLEQKSIIRAMPEQLTFLAVLLYIALFYEVRSYLIRYALIVIIPFSFLLGFASQQVIGQIPMQVDTACLDHNKQLFPQRYTKITEVLSQDPNFNGKVFSFPGDPIFYLLLNQRPPHYLNNYDGSSRRAQRDSIAYIEKQMIKYVIINTSENASQDTVPNYIRTPELLAYLLTNFQPYTTSDNFLVLKRNTKSDFFKSAHVQGIDAFQESLRDIQLENIPRSEGYSKGKYIGENGKGLVTGESTESINTFLRENTVISKNKFLVVTFRKGERKKVSLTIKTADRLETRVSFVSCEPTVPCIIDIARLPLFYTERLIKGISSDNADTIAQIAIVDIADASVFW